jgi:hypothetical protein
MAKQIKTDAAKELALEDIENVGQSQTDNTAALEVGGWALRVTLDIIGVAGLGHDFGVIKDLDNEVSRACRTLFRPSRKQ